MCVGSAGAGDCHWEAYDCAHIIRILGSKWTTKHPLSSPARLTRIYWASCRNEKEIFLTPTAAKGTERKSNNTLCDHRTALHGRRTFKTSNFLPLPQLVHPLFHFFYSFPYFPATSIFVCQLSSTWHSLVLPVVHTSQHRGQWMVDTSHSSALSISVPSRGVKQPNYQSTQDGVSVCCVLMFCGVQWGKMQT